MELIVCKKSNDLHEFIEYWSGIYDDPHEHLYEDNIEKQLTSDSLINLYTWKGGGAHFLNKKGIEDNYITPLKSYRECPPTRKYLEDRYLTHIRKGKKLNTTGGGVIFNIVYMHILSKNQEFKKILTDVYPIFDMHVYRAWHFMEPESFPKALLPWKELKDITNDEDKCNIYKSYIHFYRKIETEVKEHLNKDDDHYGRKIDKALFEFGKHLLKIEPYQPKPR